MTHYPFVTLFIILGLLLSSGSTVRLSASRGAAASPADLPATVHPDRKPEMNETVFAQEPISPPGSLMFIENVGQFDERARFQVRGGDRMIWLADDALWITLLESVSEDDTTDALDLPVQNPEWQSPNRQGVNLKLSFPGANSRPRLEPFDRLNTCVSYFIGDNPAQWHADVPVWGGVRYVDIYPGVDLEVTSERGLWAWRFAIRDSQFATSNARLLVEGADALSLDDDCLRLTTAMGEFTLLLPAVEPAAPDTQPATFSIERGGFEISAPFSSAPPLLRSPVPYPFVSLSAQDNPDDLLYATFLGGSSSDSGSAIAVDESGAIYVTGSTESSDFPAAPGAYDTSFNGGYYDIFVSKLASDGSSLLYSTFLGGSGSDYGSAIVVDGTGAAYVTGDTLSSGFPTTPGAYDASFNGGDDVFVSKLAPDGSNLLYSTFLSGSDYDSGSGIAVDRLGAAYVTGDASSSDFPTTPGAYDRSHNGGYNDVFVSKLAPDGGSLLYSTFLGGSSGDHGGAIAVDVTGAAYVTGDTESSDFPTTPEAYDRSYNGSDPSTSWFGDAFVSKLASDGSSLGYSTFLGGNGGDGGGAIAVDGTGAAYVTGDTGSSDFPTTPGAYDNSYNGGCSYELICGDLFVSKVALDGGSLLYSTFLGGSGYDSSYDYGGGIVVDGAGAAYVTGSTFSADLPTTPEAYDASYNSNLDAFVSKLAPNGSSLSYSTFLGGGSCDIGGAIVVDGIGAVYVAGKTSSSDFPTTPGAYDTSYNGEYDSGCYSGDVFVAKLMVGGIVVEARTDIGMPYSAYRGCPSPYTGCGGPYHGFYYGVCTDLAMDAYNAGASFNLQDALYQDHLAHPGRYRYGSARNPEDMRRYFHHNQQWLPHSQAYQPGDIAFFDWDAGDLSDHVGIVSKVDADGRPLRMVHAPGVCQVNPSGRAFEQDWNSHYDQHIQGHGQLSETGALTTPADETLQLLRITIDAPSVALSLRDANGKSASDTYDENLVATGVEASIPYIPGGWYADLGTAKVITVTQPLSNTSQYFVKVTGEATVTYHLRIETLQDASVTDSEVFTQAIAAGESHGSAITLSAPGGTIEFSATSPAPAPLPGIPESLELAGLVGTSAQGTFTITETGGQQALHNVALSATNLMDSLGGMMLGSMLSIDPTDFTVSAGDSQQVNAQVSLSDATPGVYRGGLVIRSDNGGVQMIPLSLDVQFHQVYLPTVLKSY